MTCIAGLSWSPLTYSTSAKIRRGPRVRNASLVSLPPRPGIISLACRRLDTSCGAKSVRLAWHGTFVSGARQRHRCYHLLRAQAAQTYPQARLIDVETM